MLKAVNKKREIIVDYLKKDSIRESTFSIWEEKITKTVILSEDCRAVKNE